MKTRINYYYYYYYYYYYLKNLPFLQNISFNT